MIPALVGLVALAGGANEELYGVVGFDPTIHRYYRACGRTDVRPLDAVAIGPEFDVSLDRWQVDARALQSLLEGTSSEPPHGIAAIDEAIACAVTTRRCMDADFHEVVPSLVATPDPACALPLELARVEESLPSLRFDPPARRHRPWWVIAGTGAGLTATGVGTGWLVLGAPALEEAGDEVAQARAMQDPAAYRQAAAARSARVAERVAGGALVAGGLALTCVAWNVRW